MATVFSNPETARRSIARRDMSQPIVGGLVVAGCLYNGMLAMLGARGLPLGSGIVALAEIGILGCAVIVVLASRLQDSDYVPAAFLWGNLVIGFAISLASSLPYLDGMRNMAIVATFTMLGMRATERTVRITVMTLAGVVLAVLLFEMLALDSYIRLFQPAAYVQATRGISSLDTNDTGLFNNALGFQGRFSFGIFSGPRTSSIFVEQVGLANFAAALALFVSIMFERLVTWQRVLSIGTILLILTSNNARAAAALSALFAIGFFLFPLLPRRINLIVPVAVLLAMVAIYPYVTPDGSDDLIGRVGVAVQSLLRLEPADLVGGTARTAFRFADSGYAFLIVSTTLFGFGMFVAYTLLIVPPDTVLRRRLSMALPIYVFANLLVSGTSVFSIKTAALLWFVVGWARTLPPEVPTLRRGAIRTIAA